MRTLWTVQIRNHSCLPTSYFLPFLQYIYYSISCFNCRCQLWFWLLHFYFFNLNVHCALFPSKKPLTCKYLKWSWAWALSLTYIFVWTSILTLFFSFFLLLWLVTFYLEVALSKCHLLLIMWNNWMSSASQIHSHQHFFSAKGVVFLSAAEVRDIV